MDNYYYLIDRLAFISSEVTRFSSAMSGHTKERQYSTFKNMDTAPVWWIFVSKALPPPFFFHFQRLLCHLYNCQNSWFCSVEVRGASR